MDTYFICLPEKASTELIQLELERIPQGTVSLSFQNSHFNWLTKEQIQVIMRGIPASVTHLDFSLCRLNKIPSKVNDLAKLIPPQVTSVSVSDNQLGSFLESQFIYFLQSFPNTVSELDISRNWQHRKWNGERLPLPSLASLPLHFSTLHVSGFNNYPTSELKSWLATFPNSIESLGFAGNGLGEFLHVSRVQEEVVDLVKSIPYGTRTLYLEHNMLSSLENYEAVIAAIPPYVTKVGLYANSIEGVRVAAVLPITIQYISFDSKTMIPREDFLKRYGAQKIFHKVLKFAPVHEENESFDYYSFTLKSLSALSALIGGILLVCGYLTMGAASLAVGAVSYGIYSLGLFKANTVSDTQCPPMQPVLRQN